ncbi:hypothetical protein NQ318_023089 [Aromia moschata]|uniref:Uncharacterized protein n=1 Tax=Aromia moschata TaxID=1265417 RepID=A0AAV8X532_9CUCU|nr:hypothetical protein NQ318_023089 [Aromia moschata]
MLGSNSKQYCQEELVYIKNDISDILSPNMLVGDCRAELYDIKDKVNNILFSFINTPISASRIGGNGMKCSIQAVQADSELNSEQFAMKQYLKFEV